MNKGDTLCYEAPEQYFDPKSLIESDSPEEVITELEKMHQSLPPPQPK